MRMALGLLLAVAATFGGDPAAEGNHAFAEGRYADAIRLYLEAQARDGYDPGICFNLGNAYRKTGDVGHAVLSYERARLLAPRDDGIREALEAERQEAKLQGDGDRSWRDFHRHLTADEWTWLGLAGAAVLLVALFGRGRLSRGARVRLAVVGLLVVFPASIAIGKHALDQDRAIVLAAGDTELLLSPYEEAEATGSVRAGQVVWVARAFSDYVKVNRPGGGASGWIKASSVERIMP